MWQMTLFLLAFAVSLDSFGVGATYGLRNIRIPFKSVMVIAFCSGVSMFISMNIGSALAALLPLGVAKIIGAVILMGIGVWALFSGQGPRSGHIAQDGNDQLDPHNGRANSVHKILAIEIKQLGIVIQILKKPFIADMDRSGIITTGEAILLGCALSLDALGAGLSAAMIGLSMLMTPFVIGLMSAAFLWLGLKIGFRYREIIWLSHLHFLPGMILILMGFSRFWW